MGSVLIKRGIFLVAWGARETFTALSLSYVNTDVRKYRVCLAELKASKLAVFSLQRYDSLFWALILLMFTLLLLRQMVKILKKWLCRLMVKHTPRGIFLSWSSRGVPAGIGSEEQGVPLGRVIVGQMEKSRKMKGFSRNRTSPYKRYG